MADKLTELEKLKNYLDEHGYVSQWNSIDVIDKMNLHPNQIIVYDEIIGEDKSIADLVVDGKYYIRSWDVVCHQYSYGGPEGKLEIYGSVVEDVDGWLTAEDIINKYLKKENNDG